MTRWENHSGTTVSVPIVGRDVGAGEVVEVPDDVVMPSNYFKTIDAHPVDVGDAGFGVHEEG